MLYNSSLGFYKKKIAIRLAVIVDEFLDISLPKLISINDCLWILSGNIRVPLTIATVISGT
jgi:hypothetical protein